MTGYETPSSPCTRRRDEICTDGFSSSNWPETIFRRRGAAAAAACREERGGGCDALGLGITDSACKNQLVVVSVQYGPFNPYIPIRSATIGKSRVAKHPIAMHTSWRSNSDIASVTRVSMTFRVVRTNQYNQNLGLIHSTNGNHLESPNEGSSIDHQVTIYLHAQNITMFPTNETWYFASQILVSSSGGLILILIAQSTRNMFRIHITLAMSLFDLQDVCIAIGSIATLDLPMVVDLTGIYGLKGPYSGQITHCPSYTFRIDLNKACDHNQLSSACYYQLTSEQYHKTTQAKYSPPEHSAQDIQNTPKLNPAKTPVCIHYTTQCLPELLTPKWFYPETTHDTTSITPYCIVQLRTVPH
ncbi:Tau class glutathione S-transferase [Dorcoceras hygrometricum]|uniref:Tau class glutathione S-transferase n=1 Tax=Dorcoceras hygrometricum TaxID=472368 RepID=A0A2Z6ZYG6_9LAMI|nr:Tau class glutathione S-transferase [Dorcoceras hygrometricum]